MLRHGHRLSKDIDIFVPDPQYLGFVSPRLSDAAERVSVGYVEGPGYVKLLRPDGEIDFVPESSDADFLVEFAADAQPDLRSFYGAKTELEQLLGRGVDLVEPGAVRNPYVLASINRNREPVYPA